MATFLLITQSYGAPSGESEELSEDTVAQLIHTAASGNSPTPESQQAIKQLKRLGLAKHIFPLLKDRAIDQESIDRQQAATRVLQRCGYSQSLDALGHCLSGNRWSPYGKEWEANHWQLKREWITAIYQMSERTGPIDDTSSNEAIDAAIPPTLRYLSARKPANARQVALPAEDPRNNVEVRLHVDKKEWLLGEPVLLHYEAKNLGDEPVLVSFGGDSRTWPSRSLRFKVIVIDEAGNLVDDPNPSRDCHGGLVGGSNLGVLRQF